MSASLTMICYCWLMTELTSKIDSNHPSDESLRRGIELLFFAYRDFTGDPDEVLTKYGFGRAHHRVLHFVGRDPGMTVSQLLSILKITKQSLSRVLSQLVREGYVRQDQGTRDRRQRLLYLSEKGLDLEGQLSALQRARMTKAYQAAGPGAVAGFQDVLMHLINEKDRAQAVDALNKG